MRKSTLSLRKPGVTVSVYATAINALDDHIRHGDDADYVPLSAIIGHDVSGVVAKKVRT